jgi:hypothetical protein
MKTQTVVFFLKVKIAYTSNKAREEMIRQIEADTAIRKSVWVYDGHADAVSVEVTNERGGIEVK